MLEMETEQQQWGPINRRSSAAKDKENQNKHISKGEKKFVKNVQRVSRICHAI